MSIPSLHNQCIDLYYRISELETMIEQSSDNNNKRKYSENLRLAKEEYNLVFNKLRLLELDN